MVTARRNARWARHGRDDAGTADHGCAVRRLSRSVPASGLAAADGCRHPRRTARHLVHVRTLLLWIGLGAPFIERLRDNKSLSGALAGITAAVVGVILNLAI